MAGVKAFIHSSFFEVKSDRTDIDCYYVPATTLANENDLKGMANVILLGKMIKETGFGGGDEEIILKTVKKVVPPKKANLIDANIKALKLGMTQ